MAAKNKILSASQYWFRKALERVRYILHSYLRVRLWKIQRFTLFILGDEAAWNKLSGAEQQFATKYSELGERHFKHCFLRELPPTDAARVFAPVGRRVPPSPPKRVDTVVTLTLT